jgi:hypothetical protein
MKDALFWRRRETGAHCLSVELPRNVLKKSGHEVAVKLAAEKVSKGTGRAAGVSVGIEEGAAAVVDDAAAEVFDSEDEVAEDEESARLCKSAVSTWISPRAANSLNRSR